MRPEDIIIKPIITEESNAGIQEGKYTFKVNKKATKVDVANAVEKLFGVKVLRVNTITVKEKKKELEEMLEEHLIGKSYCYNRYKSIRQNISCKRRKRNKNSYKI